MTDEPTLSLAAIHERHVHLEAAERALLRLKANPTILLISPPVDEELAPGVIPTAIPDALMGVIRARLYEELPAILEGLALDLEGQREGLRFEATAAYVAFMSEGG